MHGCPFFLSRDGKAKDCFEFNQTTMKYVKKWPERIPLLIVNATWIDTFSDLSEYKNALVKQACYYADSKDVYITRPIPGMPVDVPKTLSRHMILGREMNGIKASVDAYHKRFEVVLEAQDAAAELCNVKILDPLPYLCDSEYCYGTQNGRPLYYDNGHLSEFGNKRLIPMFELIFSPT